MCSKSASEADQTASMYLGSGFRVDLDGRDRNAGSGGGPVMGDPLLSAEAGTRLSGIEVS